MIRTNSPFMDTKDVTAYFGKCARTIERWKENKGFPAPAIRTVPFLYRRSDVEAWVEKSH